MLGPLLIAATAVAVSGLAIKYGVPWLRKDTRWDVDWREFIAGLIVAYMVAMPVVFAVGKAWSTADALQYQEFYNGVETSATVQVKACHPGSAGGSSLSGQSNCRHQYNSGQAYTYTETYFVTVSDGCNSKGECSSHQEMRTRTEVAYIYNPYATKEYHYAITDSIGGTYQFPNVYVKDGEGYEGKAIPADIPRGDPAEWLDAKKHLDEGNPRPVTRLFNYKNYILASQDELLKPFSKDVERYQKEGILPDHTAKIKTDPLYGFSKSYADKVSFVGVQVADKAAWQRSLMQLDAALGSKLQGDMHVVLIDANKVTSPTNYLNALKAYWLGDDFGRRAVAKNAIIVVAGVRDGTIVWTQASTGMPFGNEVMLRGIMNFLPGTSLDPAQVIGSPRTVVTPATGSDTHDTVTVSLGDTPGVLERVVLQDFPFKRACMECTDDGKQIGYKNLIVEIQPQWWQWTIMISIVTVLALIYWALAAKFELFNWLPWVKKSVASSDDDAYDDPYRRYLSQYSTHPQKKSKKRRRYGSFDF